MFLVPTMPPHHCPTERKSNPRRRRPRRGAEPRAARSSRASMASGVDGVSRAVAWRMCWDGVTPVTHPQAQDV